MVPTNRRPPSTDVPWGVDLDTVRRERQFRNPPKDHSAFPALQAAVQPHVDSFNALLEPDGLLEYAIRDIGTKTFLDGDAGDSLRNRLSVRLKEVFVEKAQIPAANKISTRNREIYPAECRERNATYRGKMRGRLEYRVNDGPWNDVVREMGQLPIMLRVRRRPEPRSWCALQRARGQELMRGCVHAVEPLPSGEVLPSRVGSA